MLAGCRTRGRRPGGFATKSRAAPSDVATNAAVQAGRTEGNQQAVAHSIRLCLSATVIFLLIGSRELLSYTHAARELHSLMYRAHAPSARCKTHAREVLIDQVATAGRRSLMVLFVRQTTITLSPITLFTFHMISRLAHDRKRCKCARVRSPSSPRPCSPALRCAVCGACRGRKCDGLRAERAPGRPRFDCANFSGTLPMCERHWHSSVQDAGRGRAGREATYT